MRRIKAIHAAVILTMMVGWACADTVEVTLTGVVTWTFPGSQIEAWGIQAGDSFTSLLTYDPNQVDQLRVRDDPVAKPNRMAAGSLLSPQRTRTQVTVVDTWVRNSVL